MIDSGGVCPAARQIASPNFDRRPPGNVPELLIVHGISQPAGVFGGNGVEQLFTNCGIGQQSRLGKVSAHFLIRRDGELVQFVPCALRAWHAGDSRWRERPACNDFSIGIEVEGTDEIAYEDAQYAELARLTGDLRVAYPSLTAVAGHCHVAQQRKTDPGPAFDWARYFAAVGKNFDGTEAGGQ